MTDARPRRHCRSIQTAPDLETWSRIPEIDLTTTMSADVASGEKWQQMLWLKYSAPRLTVRARSRHRMRHGRQHAIIVIYNYQIDTDTQTTQKPRLAIHW